MSEAQELAHRFAAVLKAWLTPAEFAEMQRRNSHDPRYIGLCCASHDFCDANMAMDAAWRAVRGVSIDADDDAQVALWNEAWDIARTRYLSEASTEPADEIGSCRTSAREI